MKDKHDKRIRDVVDSLRNHYLNDSNGDDKSEKTRDVYSTEYIWRQRGNLFDSYTWALYELVCDYIQSNGWYVCRAREDLGKWRWNYAECAFVFEYKYFADLQLSVSDRDSAMHCSVPMQLDPDKDLDQELARLVKEAEICRSSVKAMECHARAQQGLIPDRPVTNADTDDFSAMLDTATVKE